MKTNFLTPIIFIFAFVMLVEGQYGSCPIENDPTQLIRCISIDGILLFELTLYNSEKNKIEVLSGQYNCFGARGH